MGRKILYLFVILNLFSGCAAYRSEPTYAPPPPPAPAPRAERSEALLQAGDLVFYDTLKRPYSHVGIYMGDGKFVHSPKTGAQVRVESIKAAYWSQRFNGAR